ncbi:MAG TPA: hypothetical protein VEC16_02930 [Alphaproteobacteria bacterium]|nr:hypothetical protein [Alphaproteobacteria bacterium]
MNQNNTLNVILAEESRKEGSRKSVNLAALSNGVSNMPYISGFDDLKGIKLDQVDGRISVTYIRSEKSREQTESEKRDAQTTQYLKEAVVSLEDYNRKRN